MGEQTSLLPYLRNVWLRRSFPELVSEVRLPPFLEDNLLDHPRLARLTPDLWLPWIELFISPPFVRYPDVHVDIALTHAWMAQVSGKKRIYLWPPKTYNVVPREHGWPEESSRAERIADNQIAIQIDERSDLTRLFRHSRHTVLDLDEGQIAFIPAGWWHTAETVTPSISLSGNFVGPDNFEDFVAAGTSQSHGVFEDAERGVGFFRERCAGLRAEAAVLLRKTSHLPIDGS